MTLTPQHPRIDVDTGDVFEHEVHGPLFQRREGDGRRPPAHPADHDDRGGTFPHDPVQRLQAAQAGHTQIQGDDLRAEGGDQVHGPPSVHGGAHHLHSGARVQVGREQATNKR